MSKIQYVGRKFKAEALRHIADAEAICKEYAAQGYDLTLRQLYYQFVSRDLLGNTQENYKKLGSIINDARLAGLIDWSWLEDRTRNLVSNSHWTSPQQILDSVADQFRVDKWAGQKFYVEVWVEKEALAGVVERAARGLDVAFFSCRGYVSQSEMHGAALRYKQYNRAGRSVRIVHLGDHDPSGIDMTRDVADRMKMFGVPDFGIDRVALNMAQIRQYNPPPNPAKATDARFQDYQAKFGDESWELDALEPSVMHALIERSVLKYRDDALFREVKKTEDAMREGLRVCATRWPSVSDFLGIVGAGGHVKGTVLVSDERNPDISCQCPEHEEEDDPSLYAGSGVCLDCNDRGWAGCHKCKDHMRTDCSWEVPDPTNSKRTVLLCEECYDLHRPEYENSDDAEDDEDEGQH